VATARSAKGLIGLYRLACRVHASFVMDRQNAITAKGLPLAQRQARLAAMIASGEISAEHAALIDFRDATELVIGHGQRLAEDLKTTEVRDHRASA
jgi:hypothetical protein